MLIYVAPNTENTRLTRERYISIFPHHRGTENAERVLFLPDRETPVKYAMHFTGQVPIGQKISALRALVSSAAPVSVVDFTAPSFKRGSGVWSNGRERNAK